MEWDLDFPRNGRGVAPALEWSRCSLATGRFYDELFSERADQGDQGRALIRIHLRQSLNRAWSTVDGQQG